MEEVEAIGPQETESLARGLRVSFFIHALILCFFTVKAAFFAPEKIDYSAAVRVDLVGLPEKIEPKQAPPATEKNEAKPEPLPPKPVEKPAEKKTAPKAEAGVKPAAKAKDAVKLDKTKAKQKEALEKLKAMEALEKIKEEVAQEAKPKTSGKDKTGGAKVKGNVLSPGTALTGLSKLQHDTYLADLDTHIKKNWTLPEWLAKKDYKAQALVKIDDRGNILSRQIMKSSGNPSYDEEVLATIDRSAPFPPPPDKFVSIVMVDGILIGFPE